MSKSKYQINIKVIMTKNLTLVAPLVILITLWLAIIAPVTTSAAVDDPRSKQFGLDSGFAVVGVGKGELKSSIAQIINVALGFLGIVAVIIILAGGFKWMTAGGNEDKVAEGRKMIIQGVIGLVIIFAAWAIASFVVQQLQQATSSTAGGDTPVGVSQEGAAPNTAGPTSGPVSLPGAGLTGEANPSLDSDNDGLTNAEELNVYHTDPNKADTDGDGYSDGEEAFNGYSPTGAGRIFDQNNPVGCGSLFTALTSALSDPTKLNEAQTQVKECCAANPTDPLCSGML